MSSIKKRNRFSLELKYGIIKLIDEKTPFEDIVNKFRHQSQILLMLAN